MSARTVPLENGQISMLQNVSSVQKVFTSPNPVLDVYHVSLESSALLNRPPNATAVLKEDRRFPKGPTISQTALIVPQGHTRVHKTMNVSNVLLEDSRMSLDRFHVLYVLLGPFKTFGDRPSVKTVLWALGQMERPQIHLTDVFIVSQELFELKETSDASCVLLESSRTLQENRNALNVLQAGLWTTRGRVHARHVQ